MTNFIVENTDDFGTGSLFQAILDANANFGTDDITFDPNLSGTQFFDPNPFSVTDTVTLDFDVDGDAVGDVELFFDQNNVTFLILDADGIALTLDHGNITVDVDETQTTDTFTQTTFIEAFRDNLTITNNSNINFSGIIDGAFSAGGDFSNVVDATSTADLTFINEAGASIITTGLGAIDATSSTSTTIVNDGTLIATDDTIRIGTGTITNSGRIETTGTFEFLGSGRIPGFAADAIALLVSTTATASDFATPEGPVHIVNLDTGVIEGHRSGIQFFGGGRIDNDGVVAGETTSIATGINNFDFVSSFLLNNTGSLTNTGANFGFNNVLSAAVMNLGGLETVEINNSGLIESANLGIFTLDGAVLNNINGGQILSNVDGMGDDDVAFHGAVLEDFTVIANPRSLFLDGSFPFESAQGITIDATGDFVLPDGTFLAPGFVDVESVFVAGINLIALVDIAATQAAGFLVYQTDANGVTLFPATIDLTSPTLGTLRVSFDAATGFTVTDTSGNPVFNVPADRDFSDAILNGQSALIDGDVNTGLGDDSVINNGVVIGEINLGSGDDNFSASGSITASIVNGGDDNDIIRAGNADDILNGDAGDDQIFGRNGLDTINGGTGDDIIFGGGDDDMISGDAGDDALNGGGGDDVIFGGEGADMVIGNGGTDDINGGDGDDVLSGSTGADLIRGGNGDDIVFGNNQNDNLFGNGGFDTLNGGGGNDVLDGGGAADVLIGGAGQDELFGQAGNDNLSGDAGGDDLFGGAGDDVLNGGGGNDILNGGTGADQFIFNLGFGTDRIQDFEDGVDVIDFSGNVLADDFADVLAAATQFGANVRIELNPNNILIIENANINDLEATDFLF